MASAFFLNTGEIVEEATRCAEAEGHVLNTVLLDAYKELRETCFHTEAMARVYAEVVGGTAKDWHVFQKFMGDAVRAHPGINITQLRESVNV